MQQLRIRERDLDCLTHAERFGLVTETLARVSLEPQTLVYCGIHHAERLTRRMPARTGTWGLTYPECVEEAAGLDQFGGNCYEDPIDYALDGDGIPGLVTYDRSGLVEVGNRPRQWVARDGGNVNLAARALILITLT